MGSRDPAADGEPPAALFEHHPDPMLRYGPANEGNGPTVRAVNPAFEAAFGDLIDTPTGRPLAAVGEALSAAGGPPAPDDGDGVLAAARSGQHDSGLCRLPDAPADVYRYRVIPVEAGAGYVSYTPTAPDDREGGPAGPDGVPGVDGAAFAATVAHDLRNPLEVARIRLDAARDTGDAVHFEKVAGALNRIERLVSDVLALPGGDVDPEPVAVEEAAADAWATVDTGDARLDTTATAGLVITADPARLRRLFENLFRNSVEHGSTGSRAEPDDSVEHGSTSNRTQSDDSVEHGSTSSRTQSGDSVEHGSTNSNDGGVTVTVGGERSGGTVAFWVADDGPGIPEAEREQVFQAGYSSDGGTGLGLAIVGEVARAHGWTVSVTESEAGGARFEIGGVEPAAE